MAGTPEEPRAPSQLKPIVPKQYPLAKHGGPARTGDGEHPHEHQTYAAESGRAFHPATRGERKGAIPCLVPRVPTVEAFRRECAIGVHVAHGKAVKALSDKARRHRPTRRRSAAPAPLTLNLPEAVSVRRNRHTRWVHDDGCNPRCLGCVRPSIPPRICHESTAARTATPAPTLRPRAAHGLSATRRWRRVGVDERVLRVREMEPPTRATRRSQEWLSRRVQRARAKDELGVRRRSKRRQLQEHGPASAPSRLILFDLIRQGTAGARAAIAWSARTDSIPHLRGRRR